MVVRRMDVIVIIYMMSIGKCKVVIFIVRFKIDNVNVIINENIIKV